MIGYLKQFNMLSLSSGEPKNSVCIAAFITHADGSRVSIASIRLCDSVYDSVILSVCAHDITKTAETKITKLGTGIVHHDTSPTNKY